MAHGELTTTRISPGLELLIELLSNGTDVEISFDDKFLEADGLHSAVRPSSSLNSDSNYN